MVAKQQGAPIGKEFGHRLFTCHTVHTKKTVERMYIVQQHCFQRWIGAGIFLMGLFFVALAGWADLPESVRILCIFLGGYLLVSTNLPAILRANRIAEARGGIFPEESTTFYESHVHLCGEGEMDIAYESIACMVSDIDYIYLFLAPNICVMLDKKGVSMQNADQLCSFLTEKTGMQFLQEKKFIFWNLWDFLNLRRGKRR